MNAENIEISEVVIGAAIKVLNSLRPGLDEKIYERALVIELRMRGVPCEQQKAHEVFYEGELIVARLAFTTHLSGDIALPTGEGGAIRLWLCRKSPRR